MLHRLTQPQINSQRKSSDQLGKTDTRIPLTVVHEPSLGSRPPDPSNGPEFLTVGAGRLLHRNGSTSGRSRTAETLGLPARAAAEAVLNETIGTDEERCCGPAAANYRIRPSTRKPASRCSASR
jgi:hypothetical protein